MGEITSNKFTTLILEPQMRLSLTKKLGLHMWIADHTHNFWYGLNDYSCLISFDVWRFRFRLRKKL